VWGHSANFSEQIQHQWAAPYDSLELGSFQYLPFQIEVVAPLSSLVNELLDSPAQVWDGDWLGQKIARTPLNGFDGRIGAVLRGHQNHVEGGVYLHHLFQEIEPVGFGGGGIEERDVRAFRLNEFQPFERVGSEKHF